MKKQGISRTELPFYNSWTPYSSPLALFMCITILLTGGFSVFTKGGWSTSSFVSSYLDIPLVIAAFLLWKYIKGTKMVDLADIPIRAALEQVAQNPEPLEPKSVGWKRIVGFLWD
jgi:amino acid transporter